MTATVGGKAPSTLGKDALLDFRVELTLDGKHLTAADVAKLLAASEGLQLVRGRWVEVDREKLGRLLDELRAVERAASNGGLTFSAAVRMLAGANASGEKDVMPPLPTGRASSPARGWQRRWKGSVILMDSRASIPAPRSRQRRGVPTGCQAVNASVGDGNHVETGKAG